MRVPAAALALCALAASGAVAGSGLGKKARFQHTMEIFDGHVCVFGGKSTSVGTRLADFLTDYRCVDATRSIDQGDPVWRHQSSASRFVMPPLAQHTSVYNRANHIIVPYGGQAPSTFSKANQLAIFCTLYQAWGASNAVDSAPRRYLHTAVLQESSGDMLIFGGTTDDTTFKGDGSRYNKVSRLITDNVRHAAHSKSLGHGSASNIAVGTVLTDDGDETPQPITNLVQHASVMINDTLMVVLGGNVYDGTLPVGEQNVMRPFSTVYVYDVDKMSWSTRNCTGSVPPSRGVIAVAQRDEYIYIHGGVNVNKWDELYADLYELNTLTWTWKKMATPGSPVPRYAHQMKALGHYLIITHGFISKDLGNGTTIGTGDPDIYFYNLRHKAFVDTYSPKGISKAELDKEWTVARTGATDGVAALCFLLVIAVALVAGYYLAGEVRGLLRRRVRRPRPLSDRGGIRSMVESYADTVRQSGLFFADGKPERVSQDCAASQDVPAGRRSFNVVRVKSAPDGPLGRGQTTSEGATTVVGSSESGLGPPQSQSSRAAQENMRHARILDATPAETPYISRKLTLSAHLPVYRAPRASPARPAPRQMVRFSEHSDGDDADSDIASDGGSSAASRSTDSAELHAALAPPAGSADDVSSIDGDKEDDSAPLRLTNVDTSSH